MSFTGTCLALVPQLVKLFGKVAGPLGGGCLEEAGPWVGFLGLAHCDCSLLSDCGYDVTIPPPALPPDFPT